MCAGMLQSKDGRGSGCAGCERRVARPGVYRGRVGARAGRVESRPGLIGVDMTPEMISKARANKATGGYGQVEFRIGEIEKAMLKNAGFGDIRHNRQIRSDIFL